MSRVHPLSLRSFGCALGFHAGLESTMGAVGFDLGRSVHLGAT